MIYNDDWLYLLVGYIEAQIRAYRRNYSFIAYMFEEKCIRISPARLVNLYVIWLHKESVGGLCPSREEKLKALDEILRKEGGERK